MATIIKNGFIPTRKQKRDLVGRLKTCKNCDCVFVYTNHDKRRMCDHLRMEVITVVDCPSCNEITYPSVFDKRVKD